MKLNTSGSDGQSCRKSTFLGEQMEGLSYHIQLPKPLRTQSIVCSQLSQQQNFTGIRISTHMKADLKHMSRP